MINACEEANVGWFSYLSLTTIIEPLKFIRIWMLSYGQAKFLNQIWTHKIVATSTINDGENTTTLHNEIHMEQIVVLDLYLFFMPHIWTEHYTRRLG